MILTPRWRSPNLVGNPLHVLINLSCYCLARIIFPDGGGWLYATECVGSLPSTTEIDGDVTERNCLRAYAYMHTIIEKVVSGFGMNFRGSIDFGPT